METVTKNSSLEQECAKFKRLHEIAIIDRD